MQKNFKKTAREIKVSKNLVKNKNINIKIGTVENRECPETIYIFVSFWIKPKQQNNNSRRILEKELEYIYKDKIMPHLLENRYFPDVKSNIFIKNIPDNLDYNDKRNFISFEIYLHTLNMRNIDNKIPLSNKNKELFNEALKIVKSFENSDLLSNKKDFMVFLKA